MSLLRDRVRLLLLERDLSQKALAEHLGLEPGTVSQILNGKRGTSLEVVDGLAAFFHLPVADLFSPIAQKTAGEETIGATDETGGDRLTVPVMPPPDPVGVLPLGAPMLSYPSSASHLALYAYIADLTEEQARQLRRPLLDLIEHVQHPEDPPAAERANAKARR